MESDENKVIFGEYWSRDYPQPYVFKYFKFWPATGGGIGYVEPKFSLQFTSSRAEKIVKNIIESKKYHPYTSIVIKRAERKLRWTVFI